MLLATRMVISAGAVLPNETVDKSRGLDLESLLRLTRDQSIGDLTGDKRKET